MLCWGLRPRPPAKELSVTEEKPGCVMRKVSIWSQQRTDRLDGGSHVSEMLCLQWVFLDSCSGLKMVTSKARREVLSKPALLPPSPEASRTQLVSLNRPGVLGSGSTWPATSGLPVSHMPKNALTLMHPSERPNAGAGDHRLDSRCPETDPQVQGRMAIWAWQVVVSGNGQFVGR